MKCGDKEWQHCQVEKMGCTGCYYDENTNTLLSKEEIAIFNTNNWYECVSIIEKHWNQDYGTFDIEGEDGKQVLELTTGGWSDNEQLLNEIANTMFWFIWWQESKRGGYYKFLYVEKINIEEVQQQ